MSLRCKICNLYEAAHRAGVVPGHRFEPGKWDPTMTIDEALDTVSVMDPDTLASNWEASYPDQPCPHPPGYWGVVDNSDVEGGVVAYFYTDRLALRYRLDLVNRLLNG